MCYFQGKSDVKVTWQYVPFILPFQYTMNIFFSPEVLFSTKKYYIFSLTFYQNPCAQTESQYCKMWHVYSLTQHSSSIHNFRWNYSSYIKQGNISGRGSRCCMCSCFTIQTAKKYYQHGVFLNIADSTQPLSFALRSVRPNIAETVLHSLFQLFITLKQTKWQNKQNGTQRAEENRAAEVLFPVPLSTRRPLHSWIRKISNARKGGTGKV